MGRRRLPTEAQWEFAARGGLEGKRYFWGDDDPMTPRPRCNIWHGIFPYRSDKTGGDPGPSPVKSFPPNGFGLYDMAGNVWQWCADWYDVSAYRTGEKASGAKAVIDPQGPDKSFDPGEPYTPKRVTRGGSFLCSASVLRQLPRQRPSGDQSRYEPVAHRVPLCCFGAGADVGGTGAAVNKPAGHIEDRYAGRRVRCRLTWSITRSFVRRFPRTRLF